MRLADLTSPEVAERAPRSILAIPLGATEQHGPHLPVTTDTDLAVALCDRLAQVRPDVVVAPAVPYGSSGEHAGFAGTLSIGQAATELLLVELGRSATATFPRLLFVSAHGGNAEPVARAMATLTAESRDVLLFQPFWRGEPHAGRTETGMQLVLRPHAVRMDRAVRGDTRPLAELLPIMRSGGLRAVTDTGVLGDPTDASADEGWALFEGLNAVLLTRVNAWHPAAA